MNDYTAKTLPDVALTDHLRSILDRLDGVDRRHRNLHHAAA